MNNDKLNNNGQDKHYFAKNKRKNRTYFQNREYKKPQSKLSKITITGFRSIQEIKNLSLTDVNILVGANGTGKSNFLNFFEMLGLDDSLSRVTRIYCYQRRCR